LTEITLCYNSKLSTVAITCIGNVVTNNNNNNNNNNNMSPSQSDSSTKITSQEQSEQQPEQQKQQSIFIIRHGDRWDYAHPEWKDNPNTRQGDPSLSTLGHRQAREVGTYLDQLLFDNDNDNDNDNNVPVHAKDITLLSSPFLRCIQTSNELLSSFRLVEGNVAESVKIRPEYSIFEFDLWNNGLHHSLPEDMHERQHYFPRMDLVEDISDGDGDGAMHRNGEESFGFTPALPETVESFFKRCEDAMTHIENKYADAPILILVTHAACCIGLTMAATKRSLQEVNPAAPCSIYRLNRTIPLDHDNGNVSGNGNGWQMDHYSKKGGMNGYTRHMSEIGPHTFPWNHFNRNESNRSVPGAGYTGPPKEEKEDKE
jgi:broad specificity phosphatase PhoE